MRIVLKLGGSAITNKHKSETAQKKVIASLAKAVANALKKRKFELILVHGAGSFGHHQVLKYKINNGIRTPVQRIGFVKTHESVCALSRIVVEEFLKAGIPVAHIPPLSFFTQKNKRIVRFPPEFIDLLVSAGHVPLLHGDMVLDEELGGSVCSGDQIISELGKNADRIILTCDVDGVFDSDPKKNKRAKLIREISRTNFDDVLASVGGSSAKDVTGGMRGKLTELLAINKPVFIVNAFHPERLAALLVGKKTVCTRITSE